MRTVMHTKTTSIRALALAALLTVPFALAGCGGSDESAPGPAPTQPSKDFKAEAEKQINAGNVDQELESLKSEIDSDR